MLLGYKISSIFVRWNISKCFEYGSATYSSNERKAEPDNKNRMKSKERMLFEWKRRIRGTTGRKEGGNQLPATTQIFEINEAYQ